MKKRWVVVLKLREFTVPEKFANARVYVLSINGNPFFGGVVIHPPLGQVSDAANALENAWDASRNAGTDKTEIMYQREDELDNLLIELGHCVEDTANDNANPAAVIESAGMVFKTVTVRTANTFSVKNGTLKGTADATSKAAKGHASYEWQFVPADGGDFVTAANTTKASYTYINLDSGRTYKFRVRVTESNVTGDWSNIIELVIL